MVEMGAEAVVWLVGGRLVDGPVVPPGESIRIGAEMLDLVSRFASVLGFFILFVFVVSACLFFQCRLCSAKGSFGGAGGRGLSSRVVLLAFGRRISSVAMAPRL